MSFSPFAMALSFLGQCSLVEAIAHRCSVITSLLLVSPGIPSLPAAASSDKQPSENKGYINALTKAQAHTETKAHTHFRYVCALIAPAHAYTWLERQGLRTWGAD